MSDPLFIPDGFTRTHHIVAVPGLHPAACVVYRPVLDRERKIYEQKLAARDVDIADRYERELIEKQVVELNGEPPSRWRAQLPQLQPTIRATILNLIFSFTPAVQAEAEGNSGGASG